MSSTRETKTKKHVPRQKKGLCQQDRPVIEPNAAGVDVGAREMYVAISPDRDSEPVRVFPTFTVDLEALVQWLQERKITTVAMESTGVYWIPLYRELSAEMPESSRHNAWCPQECWSAHSPIPE